MTKYLILLNPHFKANLLQNGVDFMQINKFFQNNWVLGICTGLISSIIVYFLTTWLSFKISKHDYLKRVKLANDKVVLILKSYLVNNNLPSVKVIDAVIASVSREFDVKIVDLYSISIFCEELIRQIIENTYISNDIKNNYIENLIKSIDVNTDNSEIKTKSQTISSVFGRYNVLVSIFIILGSIVGITIIELNLFYKLFTTNPEIWDEFLTAKSEILPLFFGVIIFPLLLLLRKIIKYLTNSMTSLNVSLSELRKSCQEYRIFLKSIDHNYSKKNKDIEHK